MKLLDKLIRWDELRVELEAANRAGIELARKNADLYAENIALKKDLEKLKGGSE